MNESQARVEICRVGASLYMRGYVHASAGNISVRLDNGNILITPTDSCLGNLVPQELALINSGGEQINGSPASKTVLLHRGIYSANNQVSCVIHTHASHLVSLSIRGIWNEADILPPITPYYVMKVGHIPFISYRRPGDPEVATMVIECINKAIKTGKAIRGVLLDRLGPVVWHQSPSMASAVLEELEETAKLWLMSNCQAAPLNDEQIEVLRSTFGAIW